MHACFCLPYHCQVVDCLKKKKSQLNPQCCLTSVLECIYCVLLLPGERVCIASLCLEMVTHSPLEMLLSVRLRSLCCDNTLPRPPPTLGHKYTNGQLCKAFSNMPFPGICKALRVSASSAFCAHLPAVCQGRRRAGRHWHVISFDVLSAARLLWAEWPERFVAIVSPFAHSLPHSVGTALQGRRAKGRSGAWWKVPHFQCLSAPVPQPTIIQNLLYQGKMSAVSLPPPHPPRSSTCPSMS